MLCCKTMSVYGTRKIWGLDSFPKTENSKTFAREKEKESPPRKQNKATTFRGTQKTNKTPIKNHRHKVQDRPENEQNHPSQNLNPASKGCPENEQNHKDKIPTHHHSHPVLHSSVFEIHQIILCVHFLSMSRYLILKCTPTLILIFYETHENTEVWVLLLQCPKTCLILNPLSFVIQYTVWYSLTQERWCWFWWLNVQSSGMKSQHSNSRVWRSWLRNHISKKSAFVKSS